MSIDFRKNANVLAAVQAFAKSKERTPEDPFVEDGYELHVHPDLVDRLENLCSSLPRVESLRLLAGLPHCRYFFPKERSGAINTRNSESTGEVASYQGG